MMASLHRSLVDPDQRMSADEMLAMPVFEEYHHPDHEPTCRPIDDAFEAEHTLEEWRQMAFGEIEDFQAHDYKA